MPISNADDARIAFVTAHVLFNELVYCLTDQERYKKTLDQFFSLVPKLGDFIAVTLGKNIAEVADEVLDMIQDESKARLFIDAHFGAVLV